MSKEQEIKDMARLSMLENKLNDIQLTNLKMFPLVFFDGVTEAQIDYNLDVGKSQVDFQILKNDKEDVDIAYDLRRETPKNIVSYYLTLSENTENTHIEKRYAILEQSVRGLFWNSVRLQVFINGSKVYESKDV